MTYYIGLVHKEQVSSFGVQFPGVPGCYSAADDMDDLVANASEALSLWAEGMELPVPRDIEKLVADKTIAAELKHGAFLVSVPYVENDTRVVSANISLAEEARRRKLTRSALLAQAARKETAI